MQGYSVRFAERLQGATAYRVAGFASLNFRLMARKLQNVCFVVSRVRRFLTRREWLENEATVN